MGIADRTLAAVVATVLLVPCSACAQHWTFAQPGYPGSRPAYALDLPPQSSPPSSAELPYGSARVDSSRSGVVRAGGTLVDPPLGMPISPSCGAASEECSSGLDTATPGAVLQQGICEDGGPPGGRPDLYATFQEVQRSIWTDYRHYYSWLTMRDLLLGIGADAVLANTSMDQHFRDWYQQDVRSSGTDNFGSFWGTFGDGRIFIPAFAGLGLVGAMFDERPLGHLVGEFGGRVTRGYLVGFPPMLFLQYGLGASRPEHGPNASHWQPFHNSHGVSGHAFIGSVPFITAAKMTENPYLKGCFYFCSTLPAWSRVNGDQHYLSQACLGWWMGYLACRAVSDTEAENSRFTLTPILEPDISGIAMIYRR